MTRAIVEERIAAARAWLAGYAPERARVVMQRESVPPEASMLGKDQRLYLGALALAAERAVPSSGADWQALLFEVAGLAALPPGRAFGALYVAFLGRPNGPRAGWLLASLDRGFVIERLREAAGWRGSGVAGAESPGPEWAGAECAGTG